MTKWDTLMWDPPIQRMGPTIALRLAELSISEAILGRRRKPKDEGRKTFFESARLKDRVIERGIVTTHALLRTARFIRFITFIFVPCGPSAYVFEPTDGLVPSISQGPSIFISTQKCSWNLSWKVNVKNNPSFQFELGTPDNRWHEQVKHGKLQLEISNFKIWIPDLMIPLIPGTPLKIEWVRHWGRFSHIVSLKSRLTGKPINEVQFSTSFRIHRNIRYVRSSLWKAVQINLVAYLGNNNLKSKLWSWKQIIIWKQHLHCVHLVLYLVVAIFRGFDHFWTCLAMSEFSACTQSPLKFPNITGVYKRTLKSMAPSSHWIWVY